VLAKEIQVSKNHIFTWQFYQNGLQIIPTSGTITITDKAGTAIVSAAAVTVSATGDVSYTFLAAANNTIDTNFKIILSYIYATLTYTQFYLFDVVRCPVINQISDEDLFVHLAELRDRVKDKTVPSSATGTTVTTTASALRANNVDYTGGFLSIYYVDSAGCGSVTQHDARVTAYSKTTGAITFTPAFTVAIPSGTSLSIRPSYQAYIDNAFNSYTIPDVRKVVGRAAGFIDSNVVNNMSIYKSLEIYCFSQVETLEDKWSIRATRYRELYAEQLNKMQEAYDVNGDGNMSDTDRDYPAQSVVIPIIR